MSEYFMYAWIGLLFCIYVLYVDAFLHPWRCSLCGSLQSVFVHFSTSFPFFQKFFGDVKLEMFCILSKTGRLHLLPVFDRSYFNHGSLALQLQCSEKKAGGEKKNRQSSLIIYLPMIPSHVFQHRVLGATAFSSPHFLASRVEKLVSFSENKPNFISLSPSHVHV